MRMFVVSPNSIKEVDMEKLSTGESFLKKSIKDLFHPDFILLNHRCNLIEKVKVVGTGPGVRPIKKFTGYILRRGNFYDRDSCLVLVRDYDIRHVHNAKIHIASIDYVFTIYSPGAFFPFIRL